MNYQLSMSLSILALAIAVVTGRGLFEFSGNVDPDPSSPGPGRSFQVSVDIEPDPFKVVASQITSFTVNSTIDATDANSGDGICETAPGNGVCTLRAAIQETNALAGDDTIMLPSGVYSLTIAGILEDKAAFGDLDITDNLIISGTNAASTIIDGNRLDRVLHILDVNSGRDTVVEITEVTFRNGKVSADFGGAGIHNSGTLSLNNSIVSGNSAIDGGGVNNENTMIINNSDISSNSASGGAGGGIANGGTLTLTDSTVSGNIAGTEHGGGAGVGGGIYNQGTLILIDSTITSNLAGGGFGGGINNRGRLTLANSTVNGNRAIDGGGIDNENAGILTLATSTISSNSASGFGGGIANGGTLTLTNSTVSGNSANEGGGIYNEGDQSLTLNLNNVTITNNTADSDGDGAGDGGGIFNNLGLVSVKNTIIAGNDDASPTTEQPDCSSTLRPLESLGYNLIQHTTGCIIGGDTTGNLTGVNPNLGPLQDNGGATFTHALLSGSPAIDAGNPNGCMDHTGTPLISDQRGFWRTVDGDDNGTAICDMGANESGDVKFNAVYFPFIATDMSSMVHQKS